MKDLFKFVKMGNMVMYDADSGSGGGSGSGSGSGATDDGNTNGTDNENSNVNDNNNDNNGTGNEDWLTNLSSVDANELYTKLIEREDFNKVLSSEKDRFFTKGLESWKEKNLDSIKDEIRKELNPDETPVEKENRELKIKLENFMAETKTEKVRNKALVFGTENGLSKELVEHFVTADDEKTMSTLTILAKEYNDYKTVVEEQVKKSFIEKHGMNEQELNGLNGSSNSGKDVFSDENILKWTSK